MEINTFPKSPSTAAAQGQTVTPGDPLPQGVALRYNSWRDEFAFLKRAPVVYQRRTHLRVKDTLIVALQEAIHDSYKAAGVHMPPSLSNLLDRQAERAQRRQKRAERAADQSMVSAPEAVLTTTRSEADKKFRFRDEQDEDVSPSGVGRLLKTLKDPMGWKEQEMRTALLQDEHEVDDEEGRHVPQHHSLKPSGGILRGSNDTTSLAAKSASAAAQMSLDPKMQQGVARVKDCRQDGYALAISCYASDGLSRQWKHSILCHLMPTPALNHRIHDPCL